MNRLICCACLLVFGSAVFSQKVYFIFLQSESEQPFFVKLNEKTYNSAPPGYLILSHLKDSSYNFKIDFPQNKWPGQQFSVIIKSRDHGFLLKNFAEKGWGLFDLQTMGVQMSAENSAKDKIIKTELKEVSAFTEMLSKAANDPSLKEKPVATVKQDQKPVLVQSAIVLQEVKTQKEQPIVNTVLIEPPLKKKEEAPIATHDETNNKTQQAQTGFAQSYKKSIVIKKSESSTTEGFGLTFIDQYADGANDTIRIIIPNQNTLSEALVKNNCSTIASENDFLKLRKKMAGQKTEEFMINEAKKEFNAKCFTIEQIKNLGTLFLNEAAKFQFYEAAYPYSSDKNNFTVLQAELKDPYFIHRFKNLLK